MNPLSISESSFSKYVQLRFESSVFDYLEDIGMGGFDRVFGAVWYWFRKYLVYVKIKEKKKLTVAADGWYYESTCLISDYFAINVLTINVSVMSTNT